MITLITSLDDVKLFARLLVEEGSNFHPDDDFFDYVVYETRLPSYTDEEATLRNYLMERCFIVCEENGADIYSTMGDVFLKETGLDQRLWDGTLQGCHVLALLVGFFGVVFAVNGYFLAAALSTHTGVVAMERVAIIPEVLNRFFARRNRLFIIESHLLWRQPSLLSM